jgi:hypothetical protein
MCCLRMLQSLAYGQGQVDCCLWKQWQIRIWRRGLQMELKAGPCWRTPYVVMLEPRDSLDQIEVSGRLIGSAWRDKSERKSDAPTGNGGLHLPCLCSVVKQDLLRSQRSLRKIDTCYLIYQALTTLGTSFLKTPNTSGVKAVALRNRANHVNNIPP